MFSEGGGTMRQSSSRCRVSSARHTDREPSGRRTGKPEQILKIAVASVDLDDASALQTSGALTSELPS